MVQYMEYNMVNNYNNKPLNFIKKSQKEELVSGFKPEKATSHA